MWHDKQKKARLILILLVIIFGTVLFNSRFIYAKTESIGYRVFVRIWGAPGRGDYVVFKMSSKDRFYPNEVLVKKVVCMEGDHLVVRDRKYYCNGKYLCTAKKFSRKGEKLENFKFNGRIPKGMLFLMGPHKDSYDSRYYGFISTDRINKVLPLW